MMKRSVGVYSGGQANEETQKAPESRVHAFAIDTANLIKITPVLRALSLVAIKWMAKNGDGASASVSTDGIRRMPQLIIMCGWGKKRVKHSKSS